MTYSIGFPILPNHFLDFQLFPYDSYHSTDLEGVLVLEKTEFIRNNSSLSLINLNNSGKFMISWPIFVS